MDTELFKTDIRIETFSMPRHKSQSVLPTELQQLTGFSVRLRASKTPINVAVSVEFVDDKQLEFDGILVGESWAEYVFPTLPSEILAVNLSFDPEQQSSAAFAGEDIYLHLDDVYLLDGSTLPFTPPQDDEAFLTWLKRTALRHFIWAYRDLDNGRGVVAETSVAADRVSISGLGMAFAAIVMAENEGMLTSKEAERRSLALVRWIGDLDTSGDHISHGSGGIYGFPYHYLKEDGSIYRPDYVDISTIDWAMCAAGLRLAKQRFIHNDELVSIVERLIEAPDWRALINENNRVAMSIDTRKDSETYGRPRYSWGLAFSEETDLIYAEVLATRQFNDQEKTQLINLIERKKVKGFYPSWFGAGFTYNWLQLWIGLRQPYSENSRIAYEYDAYTTQRKLGIPIMGLTATSVINKSEKGYLNWGSYISNQGSEGHVALTNEVVQVAPAPYGAAMAYPFVPKKAMRAMREYVKLGYYHPLMGFPESVQLNNLPETLHGYWPANWERFDINLAALAMGLEQSDNNLVANLMNKDARYLSAVEMITKNFEAKVERESQPEFDAP
jgi:hypothetical protein